MHGASSSDSITTYTQAQQAVTQTEHASESAEDDKEEAQGDVEQRAAQQTKEVKFKDPEQEPSKRPEANQPNPAPATLTLSPMRTSAAARDGSLVTHPNASTPPKPVRRRLELTRFSYVSINEIDCAGQKFRAQIFMELRFPGGVLDPDLNAEGDSFPKVEKGQLPRPPAGWFKNQIDLKNFWEHTSPLNSTVLRRKNDILLNLRYEGEFFENMELEHFPFDMQELSIHIAVNCRRDGVIPCDLVVAEDAEIGVNAPGFALQQLYALDRRMTYEEMLTGVEPAQYPTIVLSARVYRNSYYVLVNVALPTFLFVVMALMQFFIPTHNQEVRLALTVTLVLTLTANKSVYSTTLPDIAYLTIIDKYVLYCTLMLVVQVVEGAVVGMLSCVYYRENQVSVDMAESFFFFDIGRSGPWSPSGRFNYPAFVDMISFALLTGWFLCVHVWFVFSAYKIMHRRIQIPAHKKVCKSKHMLSGTAPVILHSTRKKISPSPPI